MLNKYSGSGTINKPDYQLANELHKPIIKKFRKRKVFSSYRDDKWPEHNIMRSGTKVMEKIFSVKKF